MRLIDADALLEQMRPVSGFEVNSYAEAAAMAIANAYIKLVEKQPTVQPDTNCSEFPNNSDTIYRQQAIDEITEYGFGNTIYMSVAELKRRIEQLPSAQPETAKRIVGKSRDGMTLWYQCDRCNEPVDVQDNFCRGCGRRLVETEGGTE